MRFASLDGTRGFAQDLWDKLRDGGTWGIPRCGLIYVKEEREQRLVLVARMPWETGMPCAPEDLREAQDTDHDGIVTMFKNIGIEVIEDAEAPV